MAGYGSADDHIEAAQIHIDESLARHRAKNAPGNNNTGHCIDCEDPIPAERLMLVPGCWRCSVCQQHYEDTK